MTRIEQTERATTVGLTNLPAHRPSLIGRDEEAIAVRQRLMEAETGLLTLTGAGGCGKTSLAIHVARGLLAEFADGVWLVELAPLFDAALIYNAVASVLGVRERRGQSLRVAVLSFLRTRQALLVLDNCEHLVESCADLSEALLGGCPELRILATSREPLRTSSEFTWRVPSLPAPDPQQVLRHDQMANYAAVRLFVKRAQAVKPGFALLPENALAIGRVCARLEGMPLAVELAAARTRALSANQIAARLDKSFRILVGGSRTAPSRQRTLEATLDWSYNLLTEPEQILLARLSVFAGGFELGGAEAVCGGQWIDPSDVLDVLTRLLDKSLVVSEERTAEVRFRLLEPIRQYASERLAARSESATIRDRHALFFQTVAAQAEPELWGPDQASWLTRLERDHANLRAALAWIHKGAVDAEVELRFAVSLARFWHTRGELSEARTWLGRALEASAETPTPGLALALMWEATIAHHQGDHDVAVRVAKRAVEVGRQVGDPVVLGRTLTTYGDNISMPGTLDQAISALEESQALLLMGGERQGAAICLGLLGTALRFKGDLAAAATVLEEGVALNRSGGNAWGIGICLQDLAHVVREQGDAGRAAALFSECMALAQEIKDSRRVAECLEGFAALAIDSGRAEGAARWLGAAQALREMNGSAVEPVDFAIHASSVAAARKALGEAGFGRAWDAGRVMPLQDAIDEAVAFGASSARDKRADQSGPKGLLTAREQEVAALLAQGLSNPQIADKLVISRRTADRHVSNILDKLGFASRGQITAWAVEQEVSATLG